MTREETMLTRLKEAFRIDYDAEDRKLAGLLASAEAFAVKTTGRKRAELIEEGEGDFPEPVNQAIIMLAGHWFENPGAMLSGTVSENAFGFRALLAPYSTL